MMIMPLTYIVKLTALRLLFFIALIFALAKAFVLPREMLRLFHWDKAEHFTAFYILTVLAAAAFPRRPLLSIAIALSLLGASIEMIQALPFIARDSDVRDWLADSVAIAAAFLPLSLPRWRERDSQLVLRPRRTTMEPRLPATRQGVLRKTEMRAVER
jgi:hypothetical protein